MIVIAITMSNSVVALLAIAVSVAGLFFLIRDWRSEDSSRDSGSTDSRADDDRQDEAQQTSTLQPDMFEPDVSYEEAVETADDIDDFDLEPELRSDGANASEQSRPSGRAADDASAR